MPRIFISYRRDDTIGIAGRIYDRLGAHFGRDSVFMDVDAIPFGVDFRQQLNDAVGECDVLLAVIGENWLAVSQNGQRRLDNPRDYVRIEIESALNRCIPVIPVLVGQVSMPGENELPDVLSALAFRHAAQVDLGQDFHNHMDRLIRSLDRMGGKPMSAATADAEGPPRPSEPRRAIGEIITNPIGMKFTWIPSGKFRMGSTDEDLDAADNEKPHHEVKITRDFYLGVHQVTRGQFAQFVAETGYRTNAEKGGGGYRFVGKDWKRDPSCNWRSPGFDQTDRHPVVVVNWEDGQRFIAWLSKKDGRPYRLPTEAEWEYACRAGTTTRWFAGNDANDLVGYANVADLSAKKQFPDWATFEFDDGYAFTSPVGVFKPNPWGLYDMIGNVWEWCQDYFDESGYGRGNCVDPSVNKGSYRVVRGGSWNNDFSYCRCAYRNCNAPGNRSYSIGLRLAVSLPNDPTP